MASVSFKNVCKRFGEVSVIENFNLNVYDKEFIVLVGPSGCGKSTILRMLAGLEEITSGEVFIADRAVNNVTPKDRDIAMVFQSYALYPHMNVFDNMAFGLKLRKVPKADIQKRVTNVAQMLGLSDFLYRKPRALSGGQRQRVAVGRAIVREPTVFLMDEPLSNLDAKLRVSARAEISNLHNRLQTTFIYVTHDQVEAMTLGDRIVVLDAGEVRQFDTPRAVYENPSDTFVAQFIGNPGMNLYDAVLHYEDGEFSADVKDFHIPLLGKPKDHLAEYANKPVIIGIRPEHIYVEGFIPENLVSYAPVKARLTSTELLGREYYIAMKSGFMETTATVDAAFKGRIGEEVSLVFDQKKLHIFEKSKGKAIC